LKARSSKYEKPPKKKSSRGMWKKKIEIKVEIQ
jgi:hypothetical protein